MPGMIVNHFRILLAQKGNQTAAKHRSNRRSARDWHCLVYAQFLGQQPGDPL